MPSRLRDGVQCPNQYGIMRRCETHRCRQAGARTGPYAKRQKERGIQGPDLLRQGRDVYGLERCKKSLRQLQAVSPGCFGQPRPKSEIGSSNGRHTLRTVRELRRGTELLRHRHAHHQTRIPQFRRDTLTLQHLDGIGGKHSHG